VTLLFVPSNRDTGLCVVETVNTTAECKLPPVYKLPDFRSTVADELARWELPTPELRRQITNTLYDDIAKLTL